MSRGSLADRVAAGDPRAVSRAISLIEDGAPAAVPLVRQLVAGGGHAYVIGVTGPPGAGKSTLVDRLIAGFRAAGHTVAVIAVDPSSPFTGGAILGDRVRMQTHARDPKVFIRSMATRGHLGGLARATSEAVIVLDAAGTDLILIETVGVGQDEVDIIRTADVSIVTVVPGAGDEVQALKAGIMEIADIFVVNKSDHDGADRAVAAIEGMLGLQELAPGAWRPPIVKTQATTGAGVAELLDAIARFRSQSGLVAGARRRDRAGWRLREPIAHRSADAAVAVTLDHVGIAVADLEAALSFYREAFGFDVSAAEEVASQGVRAHFMSLGDAALELLEPTAPESPIARFLNRRGPGLHHIALRVQDVAAALAHLRSRGIRLIDETPRPGAHGTRVAFIHPTSAHGVLVELVEGGVKR